MSKLKVEQTVEAIENFAIAICAMGMALRGGNEISKMLRDTVDKGRQELTEALDKFVQPSLRVIDTAAERGLCKHGCVPCPDCEAERG